jgi:hypothetical protein
MNNPIRHLLTVPVRDDLRQRRRHGRRNSPWGTSSTNVSAERGSGVAPTETSYRTLVKAITWGLAALVACLVLTWAPLRMSVGLAWYTDGWQLGDQLALVQIIATLLAIGLATTFGVYAVEQLHVGRRSERAEEARDEQRRAEQREFERVRLHDVLTTLRHSIAHNREQLAEGKGLPKILADGRAPWEPQLDTATWDAVQADIVPLLHDPELAAALARHVDDIRSVAERVDRYFQFKLGGYQHVGNSGSTTDELKSYLLRRMAVLYCEAVDLDARVVAAIDKLIQGCGGDQALARALEPDGAN